MPATEPKQPKLPKKKAGCEGEERKNLLEMNLRDFLYYSSLFCYPADGIAWWVCMWYISSKVIKYINIIV